MGVTPTYGLPYPEGADPPQGHVQLRALAEAVEGQGVRTFAGGPGRFVAGYASLAGVGSVAADSAYVLQVTVPQLSAIHAVWAIFDAYSGPALGYGAPPAGAARQVNVTAHVPRSPATNTFIVAAYFPAAYTLDARPASPRTGDGITWLAFGVPAAVGVPLTAADEPHVVVVDDVTLVADPTPDPDPVTEE